LWFTFSYLPMAHMVWFWGGPSDPSAPAGFLFSHGALDFAGGTVVHINAAIAALVGAMVIGKRIGYGKEAMAPHNLALTMIGGSLLWVGWFGFNAGSNLEATGTAVLAMVNTVVATAAAALAWMFIEWSIRGKPSMLGIVSGAVSGLVAVTPAAGFSGPMGAIVLGAVAGAACLWGVTGMKRWIGYDDSLDVFGVHGIGGVIGALGTAIVASPDLGGQGVFDYTANAVAEYNMAAQFMSQSWGVITAIIWSGVVSFVLFKLIDLTMGLRVNSDEEREGLDTVTHGERAYNL
jgi:Amt family ammonium transporter